MLSEEEWGTICRQLVEAGFFDPAGRPRTLKAIRRVMEKMSPAELASLKDKVSVIFAPAPGMNGQVIPLGKPAAGGESDRRVLVYLSPEIERLNRGQVESVVAHEFAHALLHAPSTLEGWFIEQEADQKVRAWGFKVVYPPIPHPDK